MVLGMVLIIGGTSLTACGLIPRFVDVTQGAASRIRVRTLDDASITRTHVGLILVMAAAITIDVMKPITLAFVAPGAAAEYGLRWTLNLTAAALIGFALAGEALADNSALLQVLLIVPIWGISSLTAVTAVYAAEIYPIRIRAEDVPNVVGVR